jgi:tRNA nucleotidyltransferase (CCA-adding enzyme)
VRFAVRLDFEIATETHAEIMTTTASGIHDAIGGARLRSELLYTLAEPRAGAMFALLQTLGALRCIHPALTLPSDLSNSFKHQWRRSQYWLNLLKRLEIKTDAPLQLGLELLLSYLPDQIATQLDLGLTPEQKTRQHKLADLIVNLPDLTNFGLKKSDITQVLQKFDTPTLILAGIKCEQAYRQIVWQYLSQWQLVKSPLTGADLTQLGYTKGKQMGAIIQSLRFAMIDREIYTKEDAITYLQAQE